MRRINFPANEQETSLIRQPQLGFRRRARDAYAGVGARARSHIRRQPSPVRDGGRGGVVVSLFAICQESTGTEAPLSIHLACSATVCHFP